MTAPRRSPFAYAVVRVVPHVERGETMNAGVILLCRPKRFLAARVWLAEDAFEIVLEAVLPVHGTRDWAKAFKLGWGSESWRMLPAPS